MQRIPLSEMIADELRSRIARGELQPGDRLPSIQQLASELGVSTTSVREGVNSLKMAGLLSVKHGSGIRVLTRPTPMLGQSNSARPVRQLMLGKVFEARTVIEVGALPLALRNITDAEVRSLREIAEATLSTSRANALRDVDIRLHMAIIHATRNPLLEEALEPLLYAVRADIRSVHGFDEFVDEFVNWHKRIVDAIEKRDLEACQEAMRGHLMRGLEVMSSYEAV